jgi:hypothetical protein
MLRLSGLLVVAADLHETTVPGLYLGLLEHHSVKEEPLAERQWQETASWGAAPQWTFSCGLPNFEPCVLTNKLSGIVDSWQASDARGDARKVEVNRNLRSIRN